MEGKSWSLESIRQHEEDNLALYSVSVETSGDTKHATETAISTLVLSRALNVVLVPMCPSSCVFILLLHVATVQYYYSAFTQGTNSAFRCSSVCFALVHYANCTLPQVSSL